MTMTGHSDGDDASTGVSYLELAEVIMGHGAQPNADLRELWSRIVFNILVSNTDDHLRNHGFILVPGKGWKLSQAYDMNPVAHADGLKLNITDADNALDLELAREVTAYFRLNLKRQMQPLRSFGASLVSGVWWRGWWDSQRASRIEWLEPSGLPIAMLQTSRIDRQVFCSSTARNGAGGVVERVQRTPNSPKYAARTLGSCSRSRAGPCRVSSPDSST